MRCVSCNKNLNDSESTRKLVSTGEYLDMCNKCYDDIYPYVPTISRKDLNADEQVEYEIGTQEDWADVVDEEWQSF